MKVLGIDLFYYMNIIETMFFMLDVTLLGHI